MIDREKIIEILNNAKTIIEKWVPMFEQYNTPAGIDDAITLLKEQEPVEPRIQTSGSGVTWWNVCGNCQTAINPNDKYCHECGKPVKWE